jgi:hypothetical protein
MKQKTLYAFTTYRPWSEAIARLGKPVENRKRACLIVKPGDLIAIHAGNQWDRNATMWIKHHIGVDVPRDIDCPKGIVAIATFQGNLCPNSYLVELDKYKNAKWYQDSRSLESYRDSKWYQGNFGWIITDPVPIEPIPVAGKQGLWPVRDDNERYPNLLTTVRERYRTAINSKQITEATS